MTDWRGSFTLFKTMTKMWDTRTRVIHKGHCLVGQISNLEEGHPDEFPWEPYTTIREVGMVVFDSGSGWIYRQASDRFWEEANA